MDIYLLKFSACLLVFWLVYVLLLERQKMHHFKRFYLLGALALSLTIPQLTITEYVEPIFSNIDTTTAFMPMETNSVVDTPTEQPPLINLETVLWFIYGLGAFIFLLRFVVNLVRLYSLISKNESITRSNFIYVLLKEYRIPHSFFNYIFLNKLKFENNAIPKEVLLHEETHAKQLHSLDIIVSELFQIIFWFHPLIYILKHHIKLNHEFLADQAVLKQGTNISNYQKILLQFSSSTQNQELTSAINYSSIKKRFTIMKTQTSKTRIWVSSLLLLPIIAILFYSFAEKEYVEKEKSAEISELTELNSESNLFLVTVEKNGNTIDLKCESGCKWSHLILEPSAEPYIINDYGFSEGKTLETDKFTFSVKPNLSGIKINGIKGTAWEDLSFSLEENQVQAINQLGMTNSSKLPILEKINKDLQKRAEENYYKKQFFSIKNEQDEYIKKRFNELDYADKIKWVYADAITFTKIDITKDHFEKIKESKDYIVKINGNYTSEKELNQYKSSDFITFGYTPISKLAKMKELSVVNLITPKAYNMYCTLMIEQYKVLINDFEKDIKLRENKKPKDIINTYEFLYYNFNQFTPEIIQKHNIKPPTPISNTTSYKIIQQPVMWILVNRNGEMLVDDEIASLENLEAKLKKLSGKKSTNKLIYVKHDRETKKRFLKKLESLIKKNGFEMFIEDESNIPPPPPPPPAPKKTKGGPNTEDLQSTYNPTFLEYIIEMEKRGASFYLDDKEISSEKARFIAKNNKGKRTEMLTQKNANDKYVVMLSSPKTNEAQEKATAKQVAEYNAWAKQQNVSDHNIIKRKDLKKYKYIYNIMTAEQKKTAEVFPKIPPPPPPIKASQYKNGSKKTLNEIIKETPKGVESGYELLDNGESHYYTVYKGKRTYYNKDGFITDKKGNILPPPPPVTESTLDFVIRMAKANAKFFNEGKTISSDKTIDLIKKNDKLNINAKEKGSDGRPLVYITKKPIVIGVNGKVDKNYQHILPMVNGKTLKTGILNMTINEISKLKLTSLNTKITRFKFKIPGIKTELIKGNTITKTTLENLKLAKTGDTITLFDIKNDKGSKFSPVIITITDQ